MGDKDSVKPLPEKTGTKVATWKKELGLFGIAVAVGICWKYPWRKYADYVYTKWERTLLWDMIEPYRKPKSFTPLVTIYIAAFYTGVIGAAITEQLHKEKYWEDHPGQAVPLMQPMFYRGPWRVYRGEVPVTEKKSSE